MFIPVYVFLAIPVVSALADDPSHFLERNAKLQWGIMVCVYGMSHVPALLLLSFPGYEGKSAFLVFFLVFVVQTCMLVQHLVVAAQRRCRRAGAPAPSAAGLLARDRGDRLFTRPPLRAAREPQLQLDQLGPRHGDRERGRRPVLLHHALQVRPGARRCR